MKIGIIIAMDKEFEQVKGLFEGASEISKNGKLFISGRIGDNSVVIQKCGIGKVNAAIGAEDMINLFAPDAIISTGVAGGTNKDVNIRDIVVSSSICYHDVWCGTECKYGQVLGMPAAFTCNKKMLEKAMSVKYEHKIHPGLIVSGDWFVDTKEKMVSILEKFPEAMAVDMESGAIAHTCFVNQIPFISFRIISDLPLSGTSTEQYNNFWDTIANDSFNVTKTFIESIY